MPKKLKIDENYEIIYHLVIQENKFELDNLFRSGKIDFKILTQDETIYSLLIHNGESNALIFLMKNYGGNLTKIIHEAVIANQMELIGDILQDNFFIFDEVIDVFFSVAVRIQYQDTNKEPLKDIIHAIRGNVSLMKKVNSALQAKNTMDKMLNIAILVDIENTFNLATNEAEIWINDHKNLNEKQLYTQARNLKQKMDFHALSHPKLAELWLNPETHLMFFSGIEIAINNSLPLELYLKIFSFVFEIQDKQVKELYNKHIKVVPKQLEEKIKILASSEYNNPLSFFYKNPEAKNILDNKIKEAEDRYHRRINYGFRKQS